MATVWRDELIGRTVKVVESKNRHNIGIAGRVVDETRNTLVVKTAAGNKRLLKEQVTLEMEANGRVVVEGRHLARRPEDRVRMKVEGR